MSCGERMDEVDPGASRPASELHTWAPQAVRTSTFFPDFLTGLNISRMTLRDYINIYIIKYKSKKNSVKNTMWKKMLWVFIFVSLLLLLLLFYSWILTFLHEMNCSIFML